MIPVFLTSGVADIHLTSESLAAQANPVQQVLEARVRAEIVSAQSG